MDYRGIITVEAGKMGGKPCIRGLRFTVYDVASYLASGMSEEEILKDFPYLEKEDFQAVYEFFASIPERISILRSFSLTRISVHVPYQRQRRR